MALDAGSAIAEMEGRGPEGKGEKSRVRPMKDLRKDIWATDIRKQPSEICSVVPILKFSEVQVWPPTIEKFKKYPSSSELVSH